MGWWAPLVAVAAELVKPLVNKGYEALGLGPDKPKPERPKLQMRETSQPQGNRPLFQSRQNIMTE